jgi:hypothetical protein
MALDTDIIDKLLEGYQKPEPDRGEPAAEACFPITFLNV